MDHGSALTGLAVVAVIALLCGVAMTRLRQPAIVGYIIAGVVLGPILVEDREQVALLAELGVLLLLYLVGMELDLDDFKRVWKTALMTMLLQMATSIFLMLLLSRVFGWPLGVAILLGFVLAMSSTAVAIKMLEDIGERSTAIGQATIGVLIAQDLAVVPILLVVDALAGGADGEEGFDVGGVVRIAASVALIVLLLWYLGRRKKVTLPFARVVAGNIDLTSLAGLTFCFAAAAVSGLVGLSAAYGAFLAGLVIGNSTEHEIMEEATRPVQSILMMVFFLSIGLLLDLVFLWDNLWEVALLLAVVTVFKTMLNVGAFRLLDEPWPRAFLSGVLLGQIGEFSFLIAAAGLSVQLIAPADYKLIVSITVLSLAVSPLWLLAARRLDSITILGITSAREIMRLLFASETALFGRAAGATKGVARMFGPRRHPSPRQAAGKTPPAAGEKTPPAADGKADA